MSKKPETLEEILARLDAVQQDYATQKAIDEAFRRRREQDDAERRRVERIQAENRQARDEYERQKKAQTRNVSGKTAKLWHKTGRPFPTPPKYKDTGTGDTFGEGKDAPKAEPWKPRDTWRPGKDGKPQRLTYVDVMNSRFTADFETREFREQWIRERMEERGYPQDGSSQSVRYNSTMGARRAEEEVRAQWRKQEAEWRKQKRKAVLDMYHGQAPEKPPAPGAGGGPTDTEDDATQLVGDRDQEGRDALRNPLVTNPNKPPDEPPDEPPVPPDEPPDEPPDVLLDGPPDLPKPPKPPKTVTIRSGDGKVSLTVPRGDAGDARTAMDSYDSHNGGIRDGSAVGKHAVGTQTGRHLGRGQIYFGSRSGFDDLVKKRIKDEGVLK